MGHEECPDGEVSALLGYEECLDSEVALFQDTLGHEECPDSEVVLFQDTLGHKKCPDWLGISEQDTNIGEGSIVPVYHFRVPKLNGFHCNGEPCMAAVPLKTKNQNTILWLFFPLWSQKTTTAAAQWRLNCPSGMAVRLLHYRGED